MALDVRIAHPLRTFGLEVTLELGEGAVALVGPSGAGKTSLLRVVAGLLRPRAGRVVLDGETWLDTERGIDLSPERRSVGFVFQEYALFPHLTVEANVAYAGATPTRVAELLDRLRVGHLAGARPTTLSGGERQRVALARALARAPRVLLLDEPLAALDTHTRAAVRAELRELVRETGLPTIVVTHDFEDATTLADTVGVLVDGRLLQLGTATELVSTPATPFVASFTGASLLTGVARARAGGLTEVVLDAGGTAWTTDPGEGRAALAVYPWEVTVSREPPDDSTVNHVRAPIASLVELGNRVRVGVGPLTAEITAGSAKRLGLREGEVVVASFKATATRLLPLA